MTVKEALEMGSSILRDKNIETPVKEAGVLLAFALSVPDSGTPDKPNRETADKPGRGTGTCLANQTSSCPPAWPIAWLYAHPEVILSSEQVERYHQIVQKRSKGMPFQYISHQQEFMSLDFYVNHHCLIPRPDTEILVEEALSWIHANPRTGLRVLDIGTGSGAIAVSVAMYSQNTVIEAMDLSADALKVAETNAKSHQVQKRIQFIHADFLRWKADTSYDIVLSNPPYIPRQDIQDLMSGVKDYEPKMALDGGEDGLLFYRAIAERIPVLLSPRGAVFVEVGFDQAAEVKRMFQNTGLQVRTVKDLAGIERVVFGERVE